MRWVSLYIIATVVAVAAIGIVAGWSYALLVWIGGWALLLLFTMRRRKDLRDNVVATSSPALPLAHDHIPRPEDKSREAGSGHPGH
jgi:hypothetical protein